MTDLNEKALEAVAEELAATRWGNKEALLPFVRDAVSRYLTATPPQPASPDVVAAARHYITLFSVASDIESLMMDVDEEGFEEALSGGGSEAWDRAHLQLIKALRDGRQSFHLLLRNRATLSTPEREA